MSDRTVTETARKFYERFPFPGTRPIDRDGLILLRHFTESVARARSRTAAPLRVLDAGCGTGNTTLALARRFGHVSFTGCDNSRTSLALAAAAADRYALTNLAYRRWNLGNPIPRARRFHIILCLGVLHHTANMRRVLDNLRRALDDDGELYLWVYGRHGRYRHMLNTRLLAMLLTTKPAPADPAAFARDFIRNAAQGTVLRDLVGAQKSGALDQAACEDPVWIADQFLNPVERLLDMRGLLALLSAAGFTVGRTLGLDDDPARHFSSEELRWRVAQLPKRRQLIALDLLLKPERYFMLLRKTGRAG